MCFTANSFFPCTNICKCKVKCHNEVPASHTQHRYTHWFLVYITLPKYPPKFGGEDPSNNIQHIYIKQKK